MLTEVTGDGADPNTAINCHHNFIEVTEHQGQRLWVHRKGAISAREGEPGMIPGSMGAASYHVEGRGCAEALWSSSHGAGRSLSRTEARTRISRRALEHQMAGVWFDYRKSADLLEEAPRAYKDIDKVMTAQRELTRIVRRLRPLLSYKGM